jgi:predicted small integral membrane protein
MMMISSIETISRLSSMSVRPMKTMFPSDRRSCRRQVEQILGRQGYALSEVTDARLLRTIYVGWIIMMHQSGLFAKSCRLRRGSA